LSAFLASYGDLDWGFKRRERLDVKKPGPPFLTNSYAYVVFSSLSFVHILFSPFNLQETSNEIPEPNTETVKTKEAVHEPMQSDMPAKPNDKAHLTVRFKFYFFYNFHLIRKHFFK